MRDEGVRGGKLGRRSEQVALATVDATGGVWSHERKCGCLPEGFPQARLPRSIRTMVDQFPRTSPSGYGWAVKEKKKKGKKRALLGWAMASQTVDVLCHSEWQ